MRIIGHRGARGEAPENTLGGFAHLRDLGVRAVEFDVRQIADGALVVVHDDCLARTTGKVAAVAALRSEHLHTHNHCQHWPHWPRREPTPTLAQVLAVLEDFDHIEVELKPVAGVTQAVALVNRLLDELGGWGDQVVLTSFDPLILTTLQQSGTALRRGLLVEQWDPRGAQASMDTALQLGCVQMGVHDPLCSGQAIEAIHRAGLQCSVWTVNDPERAWQLQYWGADGLITDVPQRMLDAGHPA